MDAESEMDAELIQRDDKLNLYDDTGGMQWRISHTREHYRSVRPDLIERPYLERPAPVLFKQLVWTREFLRVKN